MVAAYKYFVRPFAIDGDKTAVPDDSQLSGSVSYQDGWTFDYQRNLLTDPDALAFPRRQNNQILNDATLVLKQYQEYGVPLFITTLQNEGVPFPYAKYAMAAFDDGTHGLRNYQSLIDTNTSTPTDLTKWRVVDFSNQVVIFPDAIFNTGVADKDAVYWDNTNNRYDKALANTGAPQNVVGIADVTNQRVLAYGLISIMTGLTPGATYYLSTTTAGQISAIIPAYNTAFVGIAKSTTELFLNPISYPPRKYNAASVYLSAVPGVGPGGTIFPIPFDTIEFDTNNLWNGTFDCFVTQVSGIYRVSSRLYAHPSSNGVGVAFTYVTINGATAKRLNEVYTDRSATTGDITLVGTTLMGLAAGVQVALGFVNATGCNMDVGAGNLTQNDFQIEYVSA